MATTELERVGPPDGGEVQVLDTMSGPAAAESAAPKGIKGIFKAASNWGELRRTPYGLKPVILFALLNFFATFDAAVFSYAGPEIAQDLGINLGSILAISSTVGVFATFGQLYIGYFADRHNRIPLVAGGTILSGVFSIAGAGAQSSLTLGTPRVIDELSERVSQVPRFSLITDYYPAEARGKVSALLGSTGQLPDVVAPILAGALVISIGWRFTTVIFATPLILLGLAFFVMLREPVRGYMERRALGVSEDIARVEDEPKSFAEAFRLTVAIRTLRRLVIAIIFLSFGGMIIGRLQSFFLAEQYGLNALQRAYLFTPSLIAQMVGIYLGGGLVDFFMRRNPGRIMYLVGGAGVVTALVQLSLITIPPLWVFAAVITVLGFVGALSTPALGVILAQVIPPSIRTQGIQVFSLAQLPGLILLGTFVATLIFDYGYGAAFAMGSGVSILGAIIIASSAGFYETDMRSAFAEAAATEEWRRAKSAGEAKLLVSRGVDVAYDNVQVLFDVDFDVEEGEIIALLGTNGAGKSTLLRAISGTNEAVGGAIVFDGRDITHMPPHEVAARGVVHMPGGRGVFPGLTVRENILLGRWLGHEDLDIDQRMAEVLEIFPVLRDRVDALAGSLSGGEQQQLSLAQAFLAKPRLLMIDELSMGLSPAVVRQLLDVVREIHRRGVTIIVVEQSVNVALQIAERCVFMEKGEVRFFGRTSELLERPELLRSVYVKGTGLSGRAAISSAGFSTGAGARPSATSTGPILEVEGLTKAYGGVTAVDQVSFSVAEGESLGLVGPNGAGKTTIFDLISGYQQADYGTVHFSGIDITGLSAEERASRGLVRRFQDARMFPSLSVVDNILMALDQRHAARNALFSIIQAPNARRAERRLRLRADALVEVVGLEAYADKLVGELSTGLRRIADLACVLAAEPKLLLLDEPSTGMAQPEAEALAPLLRRVRYETGCSMLVIEHSMGLLVAVSDRLVALDRGAVVTSGSPDQVLSDERVVSSYLGGDPTASEDRDATPKRRRFR